MKGKQLIKLLQEMDPTGEIEVCIGNEAISHLDGMPAYYDGRLQMIETDKDGCAVSATYVSGGEKIKIITHDIEDEIWEDINFPVYFDQDISGYQHEKVEEMRERAREYRREHPEYFK
jgi:hypothetical protein